MSEVEGDREHGEKPPSRPEAMRGSADLLAQHFAGRVGEAIDVAFTSPEPALERLESVLGSVDAVVAERGFHRSLDDYVGSTETDQAAQDTAYLSGAFHGVVAIAEAVVQELTQQDRYQLGTHRLVAQKCRDVANSLLILDINASASIADQPSEPLEGVEPCVLNSYMAGVKASLEGIVATVRNRLQRRVEALLESDERTDERDRLSALLFVALTNYPYGRILTVLGEEYGRVVDQERQAGNVRVLGSGQNPPLGLTESGGLEARRLLEQAA